MDIEGVETLLDTSDGVDGEIAARASAWPATMRGDLRQINLADVLRSLTNARMEGVLLVHNPLTTRRFHLAGGRVRALTPRPGPGVMAGTARAELLELCTWQLGAFTFHRGRLPDEVLNRDYADDAEVGVATVLRARSTDAKEWDAILATLGSLEEVPAPCPPTAADGASEPSPPFAAVDGASSYRTLAAGAGLPLLEFARRARDEVRDGRLANLPDQAMLDLARAAIDRGELPQAASALLTLRDRGGEPSPAAALAIAEALQRCGRGHDAAHLCREVAGRQAEPDAALALARAARRFAPGDPAVLATLRQLLAPQAGPEGTERIDCTLDLVDALLDRDRADAALELLVQAQAADPACRRLWLHEARVRVRLGDRSGARAVLEDLVRRCRATRDDAGLAAACSALLELEPARADARRQLRRLGRRPVERMVRGLAAGIALTLFGAMGVSAWSRSSHDAAVRQASEEVRQLLELGDRAAARDRLAHWTDELGPCETVGDLRRQVDFADHTERQRQLRLTRRRAFERLATANDHLRSGELAAAFTIHDEVRRTEDLRLEADELLVARLESMMTEVLAAAERIAGHLPEAPDPLLDRRSLVAELAAIQATCRVEHRRFVGALAALADGHGLPAFLPTSTQQRAAQVVERCRDPFDRAQFLAEAYTEALQRTDTHREFEPLLDEALAHEASRDFASALELFRRLEKLPSVGTDQRTVFRDHVTRNATICELLEALGRATRAGDHRTARQHLRALDASFPEIPFREFVRLPLRVETRPVGATVRCNGVVAGTTPCTLAYVPALENRVAIELAGFAPVSRDVPAEHDGALGVVLQLEPTATFRHEPTFEGRPTVDRDGRTYLVDRAGSLLAFDDFTAGPTWTFSSGDLSRRLGTPRVIGDLVVVPSPDGPLRGLRRRDGSLVWEVPDLPTEVPILLVGTEVVLATTNDRLVAVDVHSGATRARPLNGTAARLAADADTVYVATRTSVSARSTKNFAARWTVPLPAVDARFVIATDVGILTADDGPTLACYAADTGVHRWTQSLPGLLVAEPIVDAGAVTVTDGCEARRLSLADGSLLRRQPLPGTACVGPAVRCGNRLLVPTDDGLWALDLATTTLLYRLPGGGDGTLALPWRDGAIVVLPDHTVHQFELLR